MRAGSRRGTVASAAPPRLWRLLNFQHGPREASRRIGKPLSKCRESEDARTREQGLRLFSKCSCSISPACNSARVLVHSQPTDVYTGAKRERLAALYKIEVVQARRELLGISYYRPCERGSVRQELTIRTTSDAPRARYCRLRRVERLAHPRWLILEHSAKPSTFALSALGMIAVFAMGKQCKE